MVSKGYEIVVTLAVVRGYCPEKVLCSWSGESTVPEMSLSIACQGGEGRDVGPLTCSSCGETRARATL